MSIRALCTPRQSVFSQDRRATTLNLDSFLKNPGPEDQDLGHPWKGYALPCSLRKHGVTRKHLLARYY